MDKIRLPRKALATEIADELLGEVGFRFSSGSRLVVNPASGTFLSAQRRTGKSTFLKADLIPELELRGIPVIYVDLWVNRSSNPADLVHKAIKDGLRRLDGVISRLARSAGMTKFNALGTFSFDIEKIGQSVTIAEAFAELANKHKAGRVVMIIDEAQHSLSTDAGQSMMFAMKAARDELNIGSENLPRLLLVCTGSSRSKLGSLVTGKESPFYGARLRDFPMLDKSYTDFLGSHLRSKFKDEVVAKLSDEALFDAFTRLSFRPEEMLVAVRDAAFACPPGIDINQAIVEVAEDRRAQYLSDLQQQFDNLSQVQQSVLVRIIETGDDFSPYDAEALASYKDYAQGDVSVAAVQNALDGLVSKEIVWRPKRGGYFVDDPMWTDWRANKQQKDQTPKRFAP